MPPRTTASPAQTDDTDPITLLGYATKDKLQYAIFKYNQPEHLEATLLGWVDSDDYYPHITIPDNVVYNGKSVPVTAIEENAFYNGSGITGITIGKNVHTIASKAFYNCGIGKLTVPSQVKFILSAAFAGCPLKTVTFVDASSVENPLVIGTDAFANTLLTTFEVPARLKLVDDLSFRAKFSNPFRGTKTLTSFSINSNFNNSGINRNYSLEIISNALCVRRPSEEDEGERLYVIAYPAARALAEFSLTGNYIDVFDNAFNMSKVERVSLTSTMEPREGKVNMVIGAYAFYQSEISNLCLDAKGPISLRNCFARQCYNLGAYALSDNITNYKVSDGVIYAKKYNEITLVSYPAGKKYSRFSLPSETMHVAAYGFVDNKTIEEVELPAGLKTIGDFAFAGCSNLRHLIYDGERIESVGESAFLDTDVVKSAPHGEVALGGWLIGYSGDTPSELELSDNLYNSLPRVFMGSKNITSVTFPKDFENIPSYMFANCRKLKHIRFSENLKTIGELAFDGAGNESGAAMVTGAKGATMTSLVIPEGVTSIGFRAFNMVDLADKIVLPSTLEYVEQQAFYTTNTLTEIEIHRATPPGHIEGTGVVFNEATVNSATLVIPEHATPQDFTATVGWNFLNVVNGDFSSVENIAADAISIGVVPGTVYSIDHTVFDLYAIDGRLIGRDSSFNGLAHGIYIIRLDSKTRRIIVP